MAEVLKRSEVSHYLADNREKVVYAGSHFIHILY